MTGRTNRDRSGVGHSAARLLGIGALITAGMTVALWLIAMLILIAPLLFWISWNVLEFGPAVGLPELGLWATVLATLFLVVGGFGKSVIAGIVFLVDPDWFAESASVHWPEPTIRNFVAVTILAILASLPHGRGQRTRERRRSEAR